MMVKYARGGRGRSRRCGVGRSVAGSPRRCVDVQEGLLGDVAEEKDGAGWRSCRRAGG